MTFKKWIFVSILLSSNIMLNHCASVNDNTVPSPSLSQASAPSTPKFEWTKETVVQAQEKRNKLVDCYLHAWKKAKCNKAIEECNKNGAFLSTWTERDGLSLEKFNSKRWFQNEFVNLIEKTGADIQTCLNVIEGMTLVDQYWNNWGGDVDPKIFELNCYEN